MKGKEKTTKQILQEELSGQKRVPLYNPESLTALRQQFEQWMNSSVHKKDQEKKERIAEACFGQYWMVKAPVYIVVVSKTVELERLFGNRGVELYGPQNSAAVIQNMLLTIHDLGLGSCWVGAFDNDEIRKILMIPEHVQPIAVLPIGYPAEKPEPPERPSVKQVLRKEKY